jgi:hypothetical protein
LIHCRSRRNHDQDRVKTMTRNISNKMKALAAGAVLTT